VFFFQSNLPANAEGAAPEERNEAARGEVKEKEGPLAMVSAEHTKATDPLSTPLSRLFSPPLSARLPRADGADAEDVKGRDDVIKEIDDVIKLGLTWARGMGGRQVGMSTTPCAMFSKVC
jgi:hypothetical protein